MFALNGRYLFPENTGEILDMYPLEKFGELQSIGLLEHLILNGGLIAVKLHETKLYDSGDPLTWLKSQIDHALFREDYGSDLSLWLRKRLEK